MTKTTPIFRHGFTLIELLIVVAIIAILAAIAVPNFLEAQMRAKVSRIKADQRSMVTAIESYMVDNNKCYPTNRATGQTREWINSRLTTPVAYITSVFPDAFNIGNDPTDSSATNKADRVLVCWGFDFMESADTGGAGKTIFNPYPDISDGTKMLKKDFYVVLSVGPNQQFDVNHPWPTPVLQYDPTNGTVSSGDILRFR